MSVHRKTKADYRRGYPGLAFLPQHSMTLTNAERESLQRAYDANAVDDETLLESAIHKICRQKARIHGQVARYRMDHLGWPEIVLRLGNQVDPYLPRKTLSPEENP